MKHPKSPSGRNWQSWNKPTKPTKPVKEEMFTLTTIVSGDATRGIDITEALKAQGQVELQVTVYDENEIRVEFTEQRPVTDEVFERMLVEYKENYTKYKKELAWWNECKAAEDEQQALENEQLKKKQYEELKEKYG